MSRTMTDEQWREVFDPLARKHFTPDEMQAFAERKRAMGEAAGYDEAGFQKAWADLIAEAEALHDPAGPNGGDPATPAAADLARRWMGLVEQFTERDPAVAAKTAAVWQDAFADPASAARLPFSRELMGFVARADAARRSRGD